MIQAELYQDNKRGWLEGRSVKGEGCRHVESYQFVSIMFFLHTRSNVFFSKTFFSFLVLIGTVQHCQESSKYIAYVEHRRRKVHKCSCSATVAGKRNLPDPREVKIQHNVSHTFYQHTPKKEY